MCHIERMSPSNPRQSTSLSSTSPDQDILDYAIEEILGNNNPYSYSVLTSIRFRLQQFKLTARIEAHEVLCEAYLRGKKYLQSGQQISNPHAWLKKTAFNIVRERSRRLRDHPTEPGILCDLVRDQREGPLSQQALREEIEAVIQALHTLRDEEPEAAELLYLRTIEKWSWQQIRQWLIDQGRTAPNEATLRQRGARAKKRLRRIFHTVTTSSQSS